MSRLNLGGWLQSWVRSPELHQIFLKVQGAVNGLDASNFPVPVAGDDILAPASLNGDSLLTPSSLTGSSLLIDASVNLKKLAWLEWPICLVLPAVAATTTTTLGCNGWWAWNPTKFPGGTWYFEAAIAISNATYIARASLMDGAVVVKSVTTQSTSLVLVRSTVVTMPAAATLKVTLASSNAAATASLAAARAIYVP